MERQNTNEIDPKTIFKTDVNGNLLPEGSVSSIESRYGEIIEKIKEKYIELLGSENILSIYVSGSVARGATDKNSDIDTFVVVKEKMSEEAMSSLRKEIKSSVSKKSLVLKIDIDFVLIGELLSGKNFRKQFTAKLLSACVYGQDLSPQLPNFKADVETAKRLAVNIQKIVDKAKQMLSEKETSTDVKLTCRWVMKMILRNSFFVVMGREKKFTNSLDTMAKLFTKNFPQKSGSMDEILHLCNEPTDDKSKIEKILKRLSAF